MQRLIDIAMIVLAALLGLAFCWVWAGPDVLNPLHSGWLQKGDPATHVLGWWYFQNAPWGMPPGANPLLGLELSSSVVLSDSLPLFALPFKLFAAWLPERFQYWGLWFALSFALQSVFGYLIARELGVGRVVALLAALFCLIQPAFLFRISGHLALGGHWIVLCGIYLYVRRVPPQLWAWPLLLMVASAVHAYLLAMGLGLWLAALIQRGWTRKTGLVPLLLETLLALAGVALVLWAVGTFMVSPGAGGYGYYRMNLLSFFDGAGEWSRLMPDLPQTGGDYEGMNFVGIGMGALLVLALLWRPWPDWRAALQPRWLPLLALCIGSTLFALSNQFVLGQMVLFTVPLPEPIADFAAIFRSSGRMFWTVGYLIVFALVVFAARQFGKNAWAVLAVLLALQVADSSGGLMKFRNSVAGAEPTWADMLHDPVWDALGPHYARVRALPSKPDHPQWMELSYYALKHGMGVDAVHLARFDPRKVAALREAGELAVSSGQFEPDTIYVMSLGVALKMKQYVQPDDLLTELDGLIVFAPGGRRILTEAGIPIPDRTPQSRELAAGPTAIDRKVAEDYLLQGWSGVEPWGVWTDGKTATISFTSTVAGPAHLRMTVHAFVGGPIRGQSVAVSVNGVPVRVLELDGAITEQSIPLPDGPAGQELRVDMEIPNASRPVDLGLSTDERLLGLALHAFELVPGPAP